MDVHPPHEPIRSVRDFLLHLLTITVGLLIALGLEKTVEHVHNYHLVHEAEAELRSEISENASGLRDQMSFYDKQMAENNKLLDVLHKVSNEKNAQLMYAGVSLNRASYDASQSDGALALMSYEESKRYADIYELQSEFTREQDAAIDAATPLIGLVSSHSVPFDRMTPAEIDAADTLLQTYNGHLVILRSIAKQLEVTYQTEGSA